MNGAVPSSSVSSDSQDSVGASDGFPSLGLGLFVKGRLRNISSLVVILLLELLRFSSNMVTIAACRTKPGLSLHSCVQEKSTQ